MKRTACALLTALAGCAPSIADGNFACAFDADCPPDMTCHADLRCYREPEDPSACNTCGDVFPDGVYNQLDIERFGQLAMAGATSGCAFIAADIFGDGRLTPRDQYLIHGLANTNGPVPPGCRICQAVCPACRSCAGWTCGDLDHDGRPYEPPDQQILSSSFAPPMGMGAALCPCQAWAADVDGKGDGPDPGDLQRMEMGVPPMCVPGPAGS